MNKPAHEMVHATRPSFRLVLVAFAGGAPLGALGLLASSPSSELPQVGVGLVVGGTVAGLALYWLARRKSPDRSARLVAAGTVGLGAIPALACVLLQVGPPASAWWVGAFAIWAVALVWAARGRPSGRAPSVAFVALTALVLGAVLATSASWMWARSRSRTIPRLDEAFRLAVLDLDASVPLRPQPACRLRVRGTEVLANGAHPRFDPSGALWFDALAADGRRQIQRLSPGGVVECLSCGEPGNNRRPAPGRFGVFFETDRFATFLAPTNTELMGAGLPRRAGATLRARRLTFRSGPDERPLADPWGSGVVWTRGIRGSFEVVHAGVERGHGGVVLGERRLLGRGADRYVEAAAWSRDGRALLVSSGSGRGVRRSWLLDPGAKGAGARALPTLVSGSFSADGSWLCAVAGRREGVLAADSGFLLAGLTPDATPAGDRVLLGPRGGSLLPLDLGGTLEFGRPTGVSLAPDGRALALGQRSADGRERIVRVALSCRP